MKAYAIEAPETPARLVELPDPEVGEQDVLVAIRAASINGFDVHQASGYLTGMMEHRFPTIIGRDLAGIVEQVGSGIKVPAVGDEVFGFVPSVPPLEVGTFEERVAGSNFVLAQKPAGLSFDQAAALPLAGSAAIDLLDAADVKEGDIVLIVGATGGVGAFAVQLAAQRGATVIATAEFEEAEFARELGAARTVDYGAVNVADAVRALYPDGITTIIDVANQKDALTKLGSVVRSGGRVVSLVGAADVDDFAARGVTAANVMAVPTVEKLQRLGEMATSGQLTIPIEATYSLDQIEEALAAFREGKRGKLIVRP